MDVLRGVKSLYPNVCSLILNLTQYLGLFPSTLAMTMYLLSPQKVAPLPTRSTKMRMPMANSVSVNLKSQTQVSTIVRLLIPTWRWNSYQNLSQTHLRNHLASAGLLGRQQFLKTLQELTIRASGFVPICLRFLY